MPSFQESTSVKKRPPITLFCIALLSLLCLSLSPASLANEIPKLGASQTPASKTQNKEASLSILNREIISFRTSVLGIEPEERVLRAQRRINQQLSAQGQHKVSVVDMPPGKLIQINGAGSFYIAPDDIDPFQQETLESITAQALSRINLVLKETQEGRSLEGMLRASGYAALATMAFITLLWLLFKIRRNVIAKTLSLARDKLDEHQLIQAKLIRREHIQTGLRKLLQWFSWLIIFLMTYEWLSFCLSQFPYTRPLGEQLNTYLLGVVTSISGAALKAIPDLFTACVIFFLAKLAVQAFNAFFERVENGSLQVSWLADDVVARRAVSSKSLSGYLP